MLVLVPQAESDKSWANGSYLVAIALTSHNFFNNILRLVTPSLSHLIGVIIVVSASIWLVNRDSRLRDWIEWIMSITSTASHSNSLCPSDLVHSPKQVLMHSTSLSLRYRLIHYLDKIEETERSADDKPTEEQEWRVRSLMNCFKWGEVEIYFVKRFAKLAL